MSTEEHMESVEKAKYETRAKVLKALAHPVRLKLVDELAAREKVCVCDLTEVIGCDMSTVSRHLAQLKNAGLVENEKKGQMVYYYLRTKCLANLFGCIQSVVQCQLDDQLRLLS